MKHQDTSTLLVRNIRGNWSLRFVHEYFFRHFKDERFCYIDLIDLEVFPPHKSAPTILKARAREWIISRAFFRNPLPDCVKQSLIDDGVELVRTKYVGRRRAFHLVMKVLSLKNSVDLNKFKEDNVPFGRFLHTTLIAKYGIKHFEMSTISRISNARIYYRFFISYYLFEEIIRLKQITKMVFVNGRDIVGVAGQLCAFQNKIAISTLEAGFGSTNLPLYGEWNGNMHHWLVRQIELEATCQPIARFNDAAKFMESNFGNNSKWWKGDKRSQNRNIQVPTKYVCFFTTSERETTTCPTGIPEQNCFDEYDQVEQIRMVNQACSELGFAMVLRVHPNFTGSKSAKNEAAFFKKLSNELISCILVQNCDNVDSYELAVNAHLVFTYRSSLSAEFSRLKIPCIQTAPTAWTRYSINQPVSEIQDIIKAITDPKESFKYSQNDWRAFSTYYSTHGKKFESLHLEFESFIEKNKSRRLSQILKGLSLEIPKTRFKLKRN